MTSSPKIFEWQDKETDAIGWVVIDRVINGVAGGGIFMHQDATVEETTTLAKDMSRKFTICDPKIGGAKAGIRFNREDPRASEVLHRFILANESLIRDCWATMGDLDADNLLVEKVITEELKLSSYQVRLATIITKNMGQPDLSKQLIQIISMSASPYFSLIEGVVGYGMAIAVEEGLKRVGRNNGLVVIQDFGVVGSSLAYYLYTKKIAKIVAIADKDGFIMNHDGIDVVEILEMRKNKIERMKAAGASPQRVAEIAKSCLAAFDPDVLMVGNNKPGKLWCQPIKDFQIVENFVSQFTAIYSDVFCLCDPGCRITSNIVDSMLSSGKKLLVSGVNNPYGHSEGEVVRLLEEKKITIIPYWVSNGGKEQLFHRSLSVNFRLETIQQAFDDNDCDRCLGCPERMRATLARQEFARTYVENQIIQTILDACAEPIRVCIRQAIVEGGAYHFHCET